MAVWNPRANQLFLDALEIAGEEERRLFVERGCAGDPGLRQEVEALLLAHAAAGHVLDRPQPLPATEASQSSRTAETVGTVIAERYKLLEQIGEGGMGAVWMAQQFEPVRRLVALKLIKSGQDSARVVARFEAERQALALMDHANIARVFDAGTTQEGRPFFVMELVKGVPITQFCDEQRLTPRERLNLLVPVCQAIQHAHQKGIIHRDLKPGNVLVASHDGRPVPKVIDFGVAKALGQQLTENTLFTGFGNIVGTLEYMSPEQAEFNALDIDTRSDIYSLGVLLYELLTGTTPLAGKRLRQAALLEVLRLIREEEPPRPSTRLSEVGETLATVSSQRRLEPERLARELRGELDWIVMRALEKDRSRRYDSPTALARDIERYLADEAVEAGPPSRVYRARKFLRRHRVPVLAGALVLLALLTGVASATWGLLRALGAEKQARVESQRADREREQAELARDDATLAAQTVDAVNHFLVHELLGSSAPLVAQGRAITLEEVLNNAARKVDTAFPNQPLVEASVRTSLGWTYSSLGLFDRAEPHMLRALELRRSLGEGHRTTLETMINLAAVWREQKKWADAETLLRQVIERATRHLGEADSLTLAAGNNLAALLWSQGKNAEAEQVSRKALEAMRRVLGPAHPHTVLAWINLAEQLRGQKKLAEAEVMSREAMLAARRHLGESHPYCISAINNHAHALRDQGKLAEAEPFFREALALGRRVLGENHAHTQTTRESLTGLLLPLAEWLQGRGKHAEAEKRYREVLEMMHLEQKNTKEDVSALFALVQLSLAVSLVRQQKFADAEPLVQECRRILDARLPSEWPTFQARSLHGTCLLTRKKYAEAEPLLLEGYEGLARRQARMPASARAELTDALERLVRLYEGLGNRDQAARWRKELEKARPGRPSERLSG